MRGMLTYRRIQHPILCFPFPPLLLLPLKDWPPTPTRQYIAYVHRLNFRDPYLIQHSQLTHNFLSFFWAYLTISLFVARPQVVVSLVGT